VGEKMKEEYDLRSMKHRRNPYAKMLKKQISIRLDKDVLEYFKEMSDESNIPYQNLINFYLQDCVEKKKKPKLVWGT